MFIFHNIILFSIHLKLEIALAVQASNVWQFSSNIIMYLFFLMMKNNRISIANRQYLLPEFVVGYLIDHSIT